MGSANQKVDPWPGWLSTHTGRRAPRRPTVQEEAQPGARRLRVKLLSTRVKRSKMRSCSVVGMPTLRR